MNARIRRILADCEEIKKNFSDHKYITVEPMGEEPYEKFRVVYRINGINLLPDGRTEIIKEHVVFITLHAEYPRYKPVCNIATPIWHPNFRDGQICIGDIWGAGESLSDIIVHIGDMIQYKSWNSFSPLSADAAEWAINNKHLFPVGNIDLFRGEEINEAEENPEFSIDVDGEQAESTDLVAVNTEVAAVNDEIEITAEELEGIEFVPAAARMQTIRTPHNQKGRKINFKTVLLKGILWALIGSIFAFGGSELVQNYADNGTVAKLLGYEYLGEFLDVQEKANEVDSYLYREFEKYCDKNDIDAEDANAFAEWYSDNQSKYEDALDEYLEFSRKAEEAAEAAYEEEFGSDDEKMEKAIKRVQNAHTGIWAGAIALLIGLFMGLGEGFYYGSKGKMAKYALIGAGISLVIGAISGFLAQLMYSSMIDDNASLLTQSFVRGLGWSVMGAGIGLAIGLIRPEGKRILFCTFGGFLGAFLGGLVFNYVFKLVPNDIAARGVAIIIMGTLIGVGVGLLEQFAKSAWLKVIRGEFEGKEYLVFEGKTSIGSSGKNTIVLFKDKFIAPEHCEIITQGSRYVILDKNSPMGTVINGMRLDRHNLKHGDTIAIGNTVLVFNVK